MKLNVGAFALSLGAISAALSLLCALSIALVPEATESFWSRAVHVDLTGRLTPVAFGDAILGALCWGIGMGIAGGFLAFTYNRFAGTTAGNP